ncbi:uncharacterized protein G2W53_018652 [Senna tora]|uniref:Uncharacterized protein n=1 Tax=Senna tora TaxID=362788 RepID=A0A834TS95_9FABA|nr:uncharacterized protein G2W53_018652 [Senna tora]
MGREQLAMESVKMQTGGRDNVHKDIFVISMCSELN